MWLLSRPSRHIVALGLETETTRAGEVASDRERRTGCRSDDIVRTREN